MIAGRLPVRRHRAILAVRLETGAIAMKPVEIFLFGGLAFAMIVVALLLFSAPEGGEEWDAYVREHHCQAVAATDGSNRGGWRCDDGKVHYRWRQQR